MKRLNKNIAFSVFGIAAVFFSCCEGIDDGVELGSGVGANSGTDSDTDGDTDSDSDVDTDSDPGAQTSCGGLVGTTCSDTEYCAYDVGDRCGATDAASVCKPRPSVCTMNYDPVCGCDGKTYSNQCTAAAAGWGIMSKGECKPV